MNGRSAPSVAEIIGTCAELCYVPINRLFSQSRAPRVVTARTLSCFFLGSMQAMSLPEIARALHLKSHSSVAAAICRCERRLNADPEFARLHAAALSRLTALSSHSEDTPCTFTLTPPTDRASSIQPLRRA